MPNSNTNHQKLDIVENLLAKARKNITSARTTYYIVENGLVLNARQYANWREERMMR